MNQVFPGRWAAASALGVLTLCFGTATGHAQQADPPQSRTTQVADLPDDPSATLAQAPASATMLAASELGPYPALFAADSSSTDPDDQQGTDPQHGDAPTGPNGRPIRAQQKRVFGLLANYTSVTGGTTPPPPGWKTNAHLAYKQSTDYSAFAFSLLTSTIAYAQDSHPSLDTWNGGNAPFWAYTWRGLVDKTDGVAQGTFLFPSLLHEDVRYYAMGRGPIMKRALHAAANVVVARTYSGRNIPNVAGLMGKVGTQALSTTYYPPGSEDFGVLATKFTYACLRQAGLTVMREFSPDIAAHLHFHRHQNQP